MAAKFRMILNRLRSDESGTSLIEFAFTAPIFMLMLVGIGDVARGFSEKYAVQQAVNRTIERAQLGSPDDSYSYLEAQAAQAAADVGATGATVAVQRWLECDGNTSVKKAWGEACSSGQQVARYVTLTINSKFRPIFTTAGYPGALPDGTIPISARASLRVQ